GPLDACGLLGSVTVSPVASSGSAFLFATASIRHTRRDLRRALGLGVGPRRGGVSRYGGASWDRDRGGITSELIRDAAPACSDAEPIAGGGGVALEYFGNRVRALYGGDQFAGTDLLRTRCPGPGSTDTSGGLASGTFPVGVFRDKRVTLHLTRGAAFSGAGYSGRTSPDVTLVLRRRRIQQYVQVEPVPADFIGTV